MIRRISTRFDVMRDGARHQTLIAIDTPAIEMVSDAKIKTSLTGTFAATKDFDYLKDRIRPYLVINGQAFALGEFLPSAISTEYSAGGADYIKIQAYDGGMILNDAKLEDRRTFTKNMRYTDIVQSILTENGIQKVICTDCPMTLQTDREDWEIGDSYLDLINDLLSEINYNSLWFDRNGFARISPYKPPTADNISVTYRSGISLIKPECTKTWDESNTPNVFIGIVDNPDYDEPMIAKAVNDDPSSRLSTVYKGRRIPVVYNLDNIASLSELQNYVDNKKFNSLLSAETIEFETAINADHAIWDILNINTDNLKGIFAETEWTIELAYNGSMRHKAKRVNNVD